jgi:hypothetical protein
MTERDSHGNAIAGWEEESGAGATGRSGGIVDAPGKTHRKRAPSTRGAKHSDQTTAKIAGAKTMRRGHRRG